MAFFGNKLMTSPSYVSERGRVWTKTMWLKKWWTAYMAYFGNKPSLRKWTRKSLNKNYEVEKMEMFERLSGSTVLRKVHKTAESCYNFICLWLQFRDIPLKMDKVYDSRTSKWVEDDSKWKLKVCKTLMDIFLTSFQGSRIAVKTIGTLSMIALFIWQVMLWSILIW